MCGVRFARKLSLTCIIKYVKMNKYTLLNVLNLASVHHYIVESIKLHIWHGQSFGAEISMH